MPARPPSFPYPLMPSPPNGACGRFGDERAVLRRVATLVARAAPPEHDTFRAEPVLRRIEQGPPRV